MRNKNVFTQSILIMAVFTSSLSGAGQGQILVRDGQGQVSWVQRDFDGTKDIKDTQKSEKPSLMRRVWSGVRPVIKTALAILGVYEAYRFCKGKSSRDDDDLDEIINDEAEEHRLAKLRERLALLMGEGDSDSDSEEEAFYDAPDQLASDFSEFSDGE